VACRDWYRGRREQLLALGAKQGYVTMQQLNDYMPEEITDLQMHRWFNALTARGIRVVRQNEDNTCAP
jgi:hypothetical protein